MNRGLVCVVVVVGSFGCGVQTKTVCEPGRALACTGVAGCFGGQQCNADGTAWSACDCGSTALDAGDFDGGDTHHADAGPDTNCGLDCSAQDEFGLTLKRCFEFSSSPTAAESPQTYAIYVKGLFTLEGNVPSIEVDYLSSGQLKGQDFFTLSGGTLKLARRITGTSSATYLINGAIDGVQWLPSGTIAGAQIDTTRDERLSDGGLNDVEYRVTTVTASPSELTTVKPAISTDGGFTMIFNTTPAANSDAQRVFVPGTGFIRVTPSTSIIAGGVPYYLQNIRDIDAGADPCSLGPIP